MRSHQIVSFSHKHCDLQLRETLAFESQEDKKRFLSKLTEFDFVQEAFLITTCNRIEIVVLSKDIEASYHSVLGLMAQHSGINFYELKKSAKRYESKEAIRHFFEVVGSLDSLVVGESQITGQVKDAFRFAYEEGFASDRLAQLMSFALKCASEIRQETEISKHPVSIASVAVAQAKEKLGESMLGMRAVVIGTGEMGMLSTRHLLRAGCDVVLVGRDLEKTKAIAATLGENVKPATIEALPHYLNRYRLVISATSSKDPIITPQMIENPHVERWWFDLALPKDIEDIDWEKLHLYRIDDLRHIARTNHALREEQAHQASVVVERYIESFSQWLKTLSVEPVIKMIRLRAQEAIDTEIQRAIAKGFVPLEYEANLKKMATVMFNRFLHDPTTRLRNASMHGGDSAECIEAIEALFQKAPQGENR